MLKLVISTTLCLCLVLHITLPDRPSDCEGEVRQLQAPGACRLLSTAAAIRFRATPQKFRTFYSTNNVLIPENILPSLANPSKKARGRGVEWSVEPDALVQSPAEGPSPRPATGVGRLSYAEGMTQRPATGVRRLSYAEGPSPRP